MQKRLRFLAVGLLAAGGFYFLVCRHPSGLRAATQVAKTESVKTGTGKTAPSKTGVKTTAAKSVEKNPLKRFIRGFIPKPSQTPLIPKSKRIETSKTSAAGTMDAKARATLIRARDYIDSRAPHDPDDIKRLRRAESLVKDGEWGLAITLIQRLLDREQDSLIRTDGEEWTSVRQQANRLLAKLPEKVRETYRLKFGGVARDKLDEALKTGDLRSIADVATRYFHTEAGLEAAKKMAAIHLDRGEFGIAARWFARILDSGQADLSDPKWLLQAAYAFRKSGDRAESMRLLKKIDTLVADQSLVIGGRPIRASDWLGRFRAVTDAPTEVPEWWTLFGTPSRYGTVSGGEPLLLSRWFQPTTHSHPVRRHIDRLLEALTDNRRAVVPAFLPLTVGGKVIYRTLRGVAVVDAETGSPIWETREGISAEKLLSGNVQSYEGYSRFSRSYYRGGNNSYGDFHPLTGLLFHNGNYGLLSSDGRRLFVIEQLALLPNVGAYSRYSSDPEQYDQYRRSWMTNKLAAYDLASGRPVWEVGGRKQTESYDLPLAGNYFLGVPIADKGDVFVIGENNSRIRLHVLDAQTGKVKWSRLIAYSDTRISQDSVRRWFTAQVALQDGVIVCPTTVGWLVAIDRSTRSVLWAHRYSKPDTTPSYGESSQHNTQAVELNKRWTPSAPVIASGHVVYTPQEDESIVCLRLRDGKRLWQIPKGDYLYHAGVYDQNAVLVGKDKVTAVKLRDGTTAWTQPIDKSAGAPSGMGVAVGDSYHLPLQRGQLWTLDLKTGKVSRKLYLPAESQPLGNLTMYRGQVLSLTPFGLTSFEQKSALLAKIQTRTKADARDPWAALKVAEIALLRHDFAKALASLKTVDGAKLDPPLRGRYRKAMITSLSGVIRSNFKAHDAESRQLAGFVKTADEKLDFLKLAAERHDARNEFKQAFTLYRQIARDNGDRDVQREDNHRLETTVRFWVAGRLHDLWDRMPQAGREAIGRDLEKDAAALQGRAESARVLFVRLFAFHPVSLKVARDLVAAASARGDFAAAEQMLLRLQRSGDAAVAADATAELAGLLQKRRLPADVAMVYGDLKRKYPNVVLPNGKTAAGFVDDLQRTKAVSLRSSDPVVSWGNLTMRVEQSGTQYRSYPDQQLLVGTNRFPFFRNHGFQIDHTNQQLVVSRNSDDKITWLVPLRSQGNSSTGYYVYGSSFGHLLFVLHRNALHCLSPVDHRVVWTRPLENRNSSSGSYYSYYSSSPVTNRHKPLLDGRHVVASLGLAADLAHQGGLAFANERCVGIYGRRRLIVVDTLTGKTLWTLRGIAQGQRAIATNQAVFVVSPAANSVAAYRVLDGKRLPESPHLKIALSAVGVSGNEFLVADVNSRSFLGLTSTTTAWRLQNPLTGRTLWKRSYKAGSSFTLLDDGNLVALTRGRPLEVVDRQTGDVVTYAVPPAALARSPQVYVLADRDSLFVLANSSQSGQSSMYYGYGTLSTVTTNGWIYSFDRESRKPLWKKAVANQQLVMDYFDLSPVLTFSTRRYVNRGLISHTLLSLLAIDKRTGKQLVKVEAPSNQYYGSFSVNLSERYVEFRTYSHRLRLVAVEEKGPVKARRPNVNAAVSARKP